MTKKERLDELKKKMQTDEDLPLCRGATNLVFGDGDPNANILFIGEGPGYWEDQKGIPFVGNAGALLNQLLQLIKVPREDVFITNVIHHRAPNNRDPLPEEIGAYGKYLDEMISIINPLLIATLGRFSMGKFLPSVKISGVHGRKFDVDWKGKEIAVVCMYHPAAALRNGEVLRQIKEDFLKLPQILQEIGSKEKKVIKSKAEQMKLV